MKLVREIDLLVVGLRWWGGFACDLRCAGLSGRREFVIHRLVDATPSICGASASFLAIYQDQFIP